MSIRNGTTDFPLSNARCTSRWICLELLVFDEKIRTIRRQSSIASTIAAAHSAPGGTSRGAIQQRIPSTFERGTDGVSRGFVLMRITDEDVERHGAPACVSASCVIDGGGHRLRREGPCRVGTSGRIRSETFFIERSYVRSRKKSGRGGGPQMFEVLAFHVFGRCGVSRCQGRGSK